MRYNCLRDLFQLPIPTEHTAESKTFSRLTKFLILKDPVIMTQASSIELTADELKGFASST